MIRPSGSLPPQTTDILEANARRGTQPGNPPTSNTTQLLTQQQSSPFALLFAYHIFSPHTLLISNSTPNFQKSALSDHGMFTFRLLPTTCTNYSQVWSEDSGLPEPWEVRVSNSKNLPYYFNPDTKESRWEPPEGADAEKLKNFMASNHTTAISRPNLGDAQEDKIRCAHLLIKHRESRRPSSWRESRITRSKEDAMEILLGHEQRIRAGSISLGELAMVESDCSSARKRGDL